MFPPYPQPILVVHQIKLTVDDRPSLGIDGVLVRVRVVRHAHRAIAVVLGCIPVRSLAEQVAVRVARKAPAQFVPQILYLSSALNRLAVGEISHRVVAADRQTWVPRSAPRLRDQWLTTTPPASRTALGAINYSPACPSPQRISSGTSKFTIMLMVCGEVKRIRDAPPAR